MTSDLLSVHFIVTVDLFKNEEEGEPKTCHFVLCEFKLFDNQVATVGHFFSDSYVRWKVGSILSTKAINTSKYNTPPHHFYHVSWE